VTMTTVGSTGATICPECSAPVKVRLIGGEACPSCESSKAWKRYGEAGCKLVVRRGDIAEVEAKINREANGSAATARYWLPGLLALAVGMASTLLIVNLSAVLLGAFTGLVGGFTWGGVSGLGRAHMAMPPLAGALPTLQAMQALTAQEKSIMLATTVLVAPDGDGDARGMSLGSGAVIRSDREAAFVVTCSHVAMPYGAKSADARQPDELWHAGYQGRTVSTETHPVLELHDSLSGLRARVVYDVRPVPLPGVRLIAFDTVGIPDSASIVPQVTLLVGVNSTVLRPGVGPPDNRSVRVRHAAANVRVSHG